MFKLLIMYSLMYQPNYPLQFVHVVGGFKTLEQCETFAKGATEGISTNKKFIKGEGFYQCERQDK